MNPGHVFASFAYADPAGSGAIAAAVQWLGGTLLGTVATTVAVISVAAVGLMMLSGRTDLRRGASVILGCFVLFGASAIAAGIEATMRGDFVPPVAPVAYQPLPPPLPPPRPPAPSDPYAGAAVPTR